ncbi:MAG: tetratricopeptide repeat protein [Pseudomonadales bacterium]|nr:tetratricopeptide repeat protein [Pseudomonadales bacterium]
MPSQGYRITEQDEADSAPARLLALLTRPPAQWLLIVAAVVLAYAHTLDVPFYFDDFTSIRDNPVIRDWGNWAGLWNFSGARIVTYFTFSANYFLHAYDLAGYHLLNILIHVGAGLAMYWLARELLRTPRISPHASPLLVAWLPLLAALLFVLHPLQTQAVTYIVQRAAALAALFYLLALAAYVQARLSQDWPQRLLLLALGGGLAGLAFFSKQNALTLPLAGLLVELAFFNVSRRRLAGILLAGLAGLLALWLYFRLALGQDLLTLASELTLETTTVSRLQYFAIQMPVLWLYLGKFLLPFNLHLDYDIPVVTTFFNPATLMYAAAHLGLIGAALALLRRSPMLAFGLLFYYTAHLIESSIIPIRDFAFEHRNYLPNAGLCLFSAWVLLSLLPRYLSARQVAALATVLLLTLAGLSWSRNEQWRDPAAFFRHEVAIHPNNFRAHSMLGENYLRLNDFDNALKAFQQAAQLYDRSEDKQNNTKVAFFSNYILTLDELGHYEQALKVIAGLDLAAMSGAAQSLFLSRQGIIHAKSNQLQLAEEDFTEALRLNANNLDALTNQAKLLLLTGRPQESLQMFQRAYAVDPNNPEALIGLEYFSNNPPAQ